MQHIHNLIVEFCDDVEEDYPILKEEAKRLTDRMVSISWLSNEEQKQWMEQFDK
jgi:hypothetical protein